MDDAGQTIGNQGWRMNGNDVDYHFVIGNCMDAWYERALSEDPEFAKWIDKNSTGRAFLAETIYNRFLSTFKYDLLTESGKLNHSAGYNDDGSERLARLIASRVRASVDVEKGKVFLSNNNKKQRIEVFLGSMLVRLGFMTPGVRKRSKEYYNPSIESLIKDAKNFFES